MNNDELLLILNKLRQNSYETEIVEFKTNLNDPQEIAKYISALGNATIDKNCQYAWLIWGIKDGTHNIVGTTFNPFTQKWKGNQSLIMGLTQYISPQPNFEFHIADYDNKKIVMLQIYRPQDYLLAFNYEKFIRIGSHLTSLKNRPEIEKRLMEKLLHKEIDWSGEIIEEATIDDLCPEALTLAKEKFKEYLTKSNSPESEKVFRWNDITFLNKAHITKQGRITRATLLLLGKDEAQHFLMPADTKISWILRDSQNSNLTYQHFGLPFLLSSERVFSKIRNIQLEYMEGRTLFPTPVSQYDSWVIREALHNCIAHQDYHLGGKINLIEYPDKLVLSNLGEFIPPNIEWMLENQSPPEKYRNPWLVNSMIRLRMIDQMGSGIKRMFETQRNRFFPLPDYIIERNTNPRIEGPIQVWNATHKIEKQIR